MIKTIEQVAQAIQVINRHKTPKDFPDLYQLKNEAIELSIKKGYAKKRIKFLPLSTKGKKRDFHCDSNGEILFLHNTNRV